MNEINSSSSYQGLQSNLRYTLCSNMMNEYFLQFINQPTTLNLVENLILNYKNNNFNVDTPNPIFIPTKSSQLPVPSPKPNPYGTNPTSKSSKEDLDIDITQFNTVSIDMGKRDLNKSTNLNIISKDTKNDVNEVKETKKTKDNKKVEDIIVNDKINSLNVQISEQNVNIKEEVKENIKTTQEEIILNSNIPTFYSKNDIPISVINEDQITFNSLPDKILEKDFSQISMNLLGLHSMYSPALFLKFYSIIKDKEYSYKEYKELSDPSISKQDFIRYFFNLEFIKDIFNLKIKKKKFLIL